jgi:hypothetical protein
VTPYLFNYFPDIKWIGFGLNKGKVGEVWKPKILVLRDTSYMDSELFKVFEQ